MPPLPKLPPPPPQLDFPAMEQVRRVLVSGYRDMTQKMLAALNQKMDAFAKEQMAAKSEAVSYQQGAKAPQVSRRDQIAKVLVRLGATQADFETGGKYAHTSDNDLYNTAKKAVADYKRQRAASP